MGEMRFGVGGGATARCAVACCASASAGGDGFVGIVPDVRDFEVVH